MENMPFLEFTIPESSRKHNENVCEGRNTGFFPCVSRSLENERLPSFTGVNHSGKQGKMQDFTCKLR